MSEWKLQVNEHGAWPGKEELWVDLQYAELYSVNLKDAVMTGANCEGARFENWETDLRGAVMFATNLRGVTFARVNLTNVSFGKSFIERTDFTEAALTGTTLAVGPTWNCHYHVPERRPPVKPERSVWIKLLRTACAQQLRGDDDGDGDDSDDDIDGGDDAGGDMEVLDEGVIGDAIEALASKAAAALPALKDAYDAASAALKAAAEAASEAIALSEGAAKSIAAVEQAATAHARGSKLGAAIGG